MNSTVRVVLNMTKLSIPEKINKAQFVHDNILADPTSFPAPGTLLTDLAGAIVALRTAYANTADGGKSFTAIMHVKEQDLMDTMRQVGIYVEKLTKADAGRAAQAGLDTRQPNVRHQPDFEASLGQESGTVKLRVRARKGVFYKWQYSLTNSSTGTWINALGSRVSKALISGLAPGAYWFRVVVVDASGDHAGDALPLAVR